MLNPYCTFQIETLKLGWCKIGGAKGAQAVADLLLFNQSLVVLDLRGNGLKDAGAAAISAALKGHSNENLTELDMGYNEITNEGAVSVAQVLYSPARARISVATIVSVARNIHDRMSVRDDGAISIGKNEPVAVSSKR